MKDSQFKITKLLYKIDPDKKIITFVKIEENLKGSSIKLKGYYYISFNEILLSVTELHNIVPMWSPILSKIVNQIKEGNPAIKEQLSRLDKDFDTFLSSYYYNSFHEFFPAELHKAFKKLRSLVSDKYYKVAQNKEEKYISCLNKIAEYYYFSCFVEDTEINKTKITCKKVVLNHENHNELFTIADISLENFFYDFGYILYESDLHPLNCKCCNKLFFGKYAIPYCNDDKCQKEYKRVEKNRKERDRRNSEYKKPISIIDDYISTIKNNLLVDTNYDTEIKAKFEEKEKKTKKMIREKTEEYKFNKLPTANKEMSEYIDELERGIAQCATNLKIEYDNRSSQIIEL